MGHLMPFEKKAASDIESKIRGKHLFREIGVPKKILNPSVRRYKSHLL